MMRIIVYIFTCIFLLGCDSVTDFYPDNEPVDQGLMIQIVPSIVTRAFNETTAESWENKINTATIYVFAPNGKLIRLQALTTAQITAINNATNFVIPLIVPGNLSSCDIYMVVNTTPSAAVDTKTSLLTSFEQDIASYNGVYSSVTTQALRSNGFVMTGKQDGVVLNGSQTVSVTITLTRIVAKVAVDISFSSVLGLGQVTLNTVTITRSAPYSNLFPLANGKTGGNAVTLSQVPQTNGSKKYRAFFYIYENDARALSGAATITLSGSGVLLGLIPFNYSVPLNGDLQNGVATSKITRNRVYYVSINVTNLI